MVPTAALRCLLKSACECVLVCMLLCLCLYTVICVLECAHVFAPIKFQYVLVCVYTCILCLTVHLCSDSSA